MRKYLAPILLCTSMLLLTVVAYFYPIRFDLTADQRYSLSDATKTMLRSVNEPIEVQVLLSGDLNSSFIRLQRATNELLQEMARVGNIRIIPPTQEACQNLQPTVIHEREHDGKTVQTTIYPYARIYYHNRQTIVPLLRNNRTLSGEQNLNISIQNLEYAFAEAIHSITRSTVERIAFLEGHGEYDETEVFDAQQQLSRYFDVDRGALTNDVSALDNYKVVVIAAPQAPFTEQDKYILDQYLMHGGRILWALDGVRFSDQSLSQDGFTPLIPLDLHLTDMLFRYGVRINPVLVQDLQCMTIPVDVSGNVGEPQYQPMPWTYAPLLLTSGESAITKDVMQVSSVFASTIDTVGSSTPITKTVLLATSTASRITATPAEIDLSDMHISPQLFNAAYLPVAIRLEGLFPSVFAHRMVPDGLTHSDRRDCSTPTKQIVVASGSIMLNHWQQGTPLPVGFDRYTGIQFGNRDFIVNAVLDLADDNGLIRLREKTVALRLLNDRRAHQNISFIRVLSITLPLLFIALLWAGIALTRRHRYVH